MKYRVESPLLWMIVLLCVLAKVNAAEAMVDKKADVVTPKTVNEFLKDTRMHDGLFALYQKNETGSVYLRLKSTQIGKEYIHFLHAMDSLPESGYFRGAYWDARIYSVQRYFNRIDVRSEPTSLYFEPGHPLERARFANVNRAVLVSAPIEFEDKKTGDIYIKADELFLKETLRQIKPTPNPEAKPGEAFPLGNLSAEKTRYVQLKNYPKNTDITVEYVFENPAPFRKPDTGFSTAELAINDERNISIVLRHSFIEVPQNNFVTRRDDPRVGFFTEVVQDMTSSNAIPWRDVIHRWDLRKKDPGAALSEPIEPIVWWIENTTPHEYRDVIRDATLRWNRAFEKIGFRNAIQVHIQPDNAEWDAGDIRYNVLRWHAAPNPQFGGYGPSFVNPRNGQILGADVMLEHANIRGVFFDASLYETTSSMSQRMDHAALYKPMATGRAMLLAMGKSAEREHALLSDFLYYLVLHEVGHTLGLNHNMHASHYRALDDLHDSAKTKISGLTASVMDYPALNIAGPGKSQGEYFTTVPGPYDDWAIAYGYSEALPDASAEEQRLQQLLSQSTKVELAFGNDADDMRSVGAGIDPRVMIFDLSSDAIGFAEQRLHLINVLRDRLQANVLQTGDSHQKLVIAFRALLADARDAAAVLSRYVGGIEVDRAVVGQADAAVPLKPIAHVDQRRAMHVLASAVFAPDALSFTPELLAQLQNQRRSFYFYGKTEDPKVHDQIWAVQNAALEHLLNPALHKRLVDSALYGNRYSLVDMFNDLTDAIFAADSKSSVNSRRQNLQQDYVVRLVALLQVKPAEPNVPPSMNNAVIHQQLLRIRDGLQMRSVDGSTKAHRDYLNYIIKKALETPAT